MVIHSKLCHFTNLKKVLTDTSERFTQVSGMMFIAQPAGVFVCHLTIKIIGTTDVGLELAI